MGLPIQVRKIEKVKEGEKIIQKSMTLVHEKWHVQWKKARQ